MLSYAEEQLTAWAMAGVASTFVRAAGRSGWRAAGFGLMTVPLTLTMLGIWQSIAPLVQGGTVLEAASTRQLSNQYIGALLRNLGYLGAGFLLWATEGRWERVALRPLARELGRHVPLWRSEGASAAVGAAAIPLLWLGNVVLNLATQGWEGLRSGDESQYFTNMTLYHAILLSATAALGEELLFRGFLQGLLLRAFRSRPRGLALGAAVVLQATVFGFAHAGYGNFAHVLYPALFGVLAGFMVWRFGLWSAIALHFLADFYIFGLEAAANAPWLGGVMGGLFLANVVLAVVVGVQVILGPRKRNSGA